MRRYITIYQEVIGREGTTVGVKYTRITTIHLQLHSTFTTNSQFAIQLYSLVLNFTAQKVTYFLLLFFLLLIASFSVYNCGISYLLSKKTKNKNIQSLRGPTGFITSEIHLKNCIPSYFKLLNRRYNFLMKDDSIAVGIL